MSAHTKRLKRYCEMRERFPMKQIGDGLHIIQAGTEFEAEVRLSDLRLLLAENEKLREALRDASTYLENTNPLNAAGGLRNMDLRERFAKLLGEPQ